MAYKLNQKHEVFTVTDGPFAGKTYKHGISYDDVPPQEKHKFEPAEGKEQSAKRKTPSPERTMQSAKPEGGE